MKKLVLMLFAILILYPLSTVRAYVILHDRHDEFMNYIEDKGARNIINVAIGSSLVDMKAEDKMDSGGDSPFDNAATPEQADLNESTGTFNYLNIEYSLANAWYGFALGAVQSFAEMKKEKDKKAIRYSDYYFGKCYDIYKPKASDAVAAIGVSFEIERFRDQKTISYTYTSTDHTIEKELDRKRDAKFQLYDFSIYADAASPYYFHILSARAGLGRMSADKLNAMFDETAIDYDYYRSTAESWYFKYGFTLGLRLGVLFSMFDLDCRTSLAGKVHDKYAADSDLGYGGMAIVSPTSMVDKNFFKASRGALVLGLDFNYVKLTVSGGVEYVNLHYMLTENRYETTSFIKVDAEAAVTASW